MMDFSRDISADSASIPKVHLIYRVCDRVEVCSARKRCFEVPKSHIIARCLDSMRESVRGSVGTVRLDVTVVEDMCTDGTLSKVADSFGGVDMRIVHLNAGSNAMSFCACVNLAQEFDDGDIAFFCEDDYTFMVDDLFQRMSASMQHLSARERGYVGIMPDDYPDRYIHGARTAKVVSTEYGHFMSIDKTTCTFSTFVGAVRRHSSNLLNFIKWPYVGEDQSVNMMWRSVPLFCPIPGWTLHSQLKSIIPAYLDYGKINDYFMETTA